MDRFESLAKAYLEHVGLFPVIYEPDGNVPPDFLVAGSIAVEVRLLNQHEATGDSPRGLEYDAMPLLSGVRRLLAGLGPAGTEPSWFVMYKFSRPVPLWRELAPLVQRALEHFQSNDPVSGAKVWVSPTFSLEFVRASSPLDSRFELGGYADHDSGGWLLSELKRNIELCAAEKSRKIARVRPKYATWWLVLIDQIGYAMNDFERELFQANIQIEHDWDRIVLVDPRDATRAVSIARPDGSG